MDLKQKIKATYDSYRNAFENDGAADFFPAEKPTVSLTKSNSHKWHSKNY